MADWIWHAAHWTHEPWTLWTAAFVHLSAAHALANALALLSLVALGRAWRLGRVTVLAALLAWPLSVASLALWPGVSSYAGLSGPLHALAAVMVVHRTAAIWRRHHRADPSAVVLAMGLAIKLGLDAAWARPVAWDAAWGFNVVYAAHLGGALIGVTTGLVTGLLCAPTGQPRRRAAPPASPDTPQ